MTNKATDKPLTLQECKDKVVERNSKKDWTDLLLYELTLEDVDFHAEAAELYKDSALKAQKGEIDRLQAEAKDAKEIIYKRNQEIEALKQALRKAKDLRFISPSLREEIENLLK